MTRLERQAAVDALTGLATRRVLDEAARSAISGAVSHDGTSLILLDVDEFKSVNDRYGHPAGDEVLVQLADYLVRSARRDDVVSRLGGDEMAVLLPGCAVTSLQRRAEQIVADVGTHPFVLPSGEEIRVSVSVGLANVPADAVDLRPLPQGRPGPVRGERIRPEPGRSAGRRHTAAARGVTTQGSRCPWVRATCKPACTSAALHADATERASCLEQAWAAQRGLQPSDVDNSMDERVRICSVTAPRRGPTILAVVISSKPWTRRPPRGIRCLASAALLITSSRARGASGIASKNTARSLITGPVVAVSRGTETVMSLKRITALMAGGALAVAVAATASPAVAASQGTWGVGPVAAAPAPTAGGATAYYNIGGPGGIVTGPDGNLWFTNASNDTIGKITPAGAVSTYSSPGNISQPFEIIAGPDGNLWFTNNGWGGGNTIGRITPSGAVTSYSSTEVQALRGIVLGPDGAMWFTSHGLPGIGRITTDGTITYHTNPGHAGAGRDHRRV